MVRERRWTRETPLCTMTCSSSSFRSFPRRRCRHFTIDLKTSYTISLLHKRNNERNNNRRNKAATNPWRNPRQGCKVSNERRNRWSCGDGAQCRCSNVDEDNGASLLLRNNNALIVMPLRLCSSPLSFGFANVNMYTTTRFVG